ncbi:MAG TPA: radical SAM family heme chaperone HemW, partial [Desulfobacteria bacterium]|nr:radical SAM family heme chaperone HemW [Desulfobacteria bacterium]
MSETNLAPNELMTNSSLTPGAYVHIPFCVRKCNYCDFPSVPVAGWDVEEYLDALDQEMAFTGKLAVSSLFVGGGTPSVLTLRQLERLFKGVTRSLTLVPGAEITVEANPGTVDLEKLLLLKQLGVNRLSLGVQSFDDFLLRRLGRIHSAEQAVEAYQLARQAGFANINLDLMHGLPGQTMKAWQKTLQQAVSLRTEHLSVYGLIIEENTPFGDAYDAGSLTLPEEELRADMMLWTKKYLEGEGYKHYEISNYARPGFECRHNQIYWRNLPYLGFGAGAASYWQGIRRTNHADIAKYIAAVKSATAPVAESERADITQQMSETMFLGLRLLSGVNKQQFATRFGQEIDCVYGNQIRELQAKGLLIVDDQSLRLSERGIPL